MSDVLPLDSALPTRVRFSKAHKLEDRIKRLVAALSIVGGATLSSSGPVYMLSNIAKGDDTGNATTLLTHMGGLEKTHDYDGGRYLGDPDTGSIVSTDVTRNGKPIDDFIDNLLSLPGNFSIFLGGLALAGIGLGALSEKNSKSLKTRIREALQKGEQITFTKGNMTLGIQLNISSAGVEQVTFIKNGVTGYKSYNGINVDTIIEKIIDAYTKRDSLENILP